MTAPEGASSVNQTPQPMESHAPGPEPPLDMAQAVWQLRMLICWLGLAVLVLSVAFDGFVWKQNRDLASETGFRKQQAAQLQSGQQRLKGAVEELARYSYGNPELTAIFERFGFRITIPPASNAPPASVPTP